MKQQHKNKAAQPPKRKHCACGRTLPNHYPAQRCQSCEVKWGTR